MIGLQPKGAINGAVISAVAHEGLRVEINGKPARLAIVTDDGEIVACGADVEREAAAVARKSLENMWKAKGWLRELSQPIPLTGRAA